VSVGAKPIKPCNGGVDGEEFAAGGIGVGLLAESGDNCRCVAGGESGGWKAEGESGVGDVGGIDKKEGVEAEEWVGGEEGGGKGAESAVEGHPGGCRVGMEEIGRGRCVVGG